MRKAKWFSCLWIVLIVVAATTAQSLARKDAAEEQSVSEHLKIFEPLLGKTFRGEFAGSTPEKPQIDISRWERALNGQGVRTLHSINDGEYGGESIIMWDATEKKIRYWYFTTAGFYTTGTMTVDGKKWLGAEKVEGNANGITEVRSISQVLPDGRLSVKSEYLQGDKWIPGHEVNYVESPSAEVKFR